MKKTFPILIAAFVAFTMFAGCEKADKPDPKKDDPDTTEYLYFEAVEAGATVKMEIVGSVDAPSLEYSTDLTEWTSYDLNKPEVIKLEKAGDKVYWRSPGKLDRFSKDETNYIHFVLGKKKVAAGGNIMSLVDKTCESVTIPSRCCFAWLFDNGTALVSSPKLPATNLKDGCYFHMFNGCISLEKAPELPATSLALGCYEYMFLGCTSLKEAPELPAAELWLACYMNMFADCASLEKAPELPATKLAEYCYDGMFQGCTSLKEAPELPAMNLSKRCYAWMFNGCTSLEKAPELPATKLAEQCYYAMFQSCTSLKEAPELPAMNLAENCYAWMFNGCTSLEKAPELPATELAPYCYSTMFSECAITEAPELPAKELVEFCYESMFYDCPNLSHIKVGFENWGSDSATLEWVVGVPSAGSFECPDGLEVKYGDNFIPTGWGVNDTATPPAAAS